MVVVVVVFLCWLLMSWNLLKVYNLFRSPVPGYSIENLEKKKKINIIVNPQINNQNISQFLLRNYTTAL